MPFGAVSFRPIPPSHGTLAAHGIAASYAREQLPSPADGICSQKGLGDTLQDGSVESPLETVMGARVAQQTSELLGKLTAREAEVIRLRFGIGGTMEHTLEEVGERFSVTRERIRQIEATALERIRRQTAPKSIAPLLDG
jgi:RNA polymerase sigma factor (sigma-70 family)